MSILRTVYTVFVEICTIKFKRFRQFYTHPSSLDVHYTDAPGRERTCL